MSKLEYEYVKIDRDLVFTGQFDLKGYNTTKYVEYPKISDKVTVDFNKDQSTSRVFVPMVKTLTNIGSLKRVLNNDFTELIAEGNAVDETQLSPDNVLQTTLQESLTTISDLEVKNNQLTEKLKNTESENETLRRLNEALSTRETESPIENIET